MRKAFVASVLFSIVLAGKAHAQAENGAADRLQAIERSIRDLQDRVSELSSLLRAALPPAAVADTNELQISGIGPRKGSATAPLILIEFSDFECPFCSRHAAAVYPQLQRTYVDSGKLQYIFRHLPITQIHALALKAAEAAECAHEQGKFWEMHDRLFEHQKSLRPDDLLAHARAVGVDDERLKRCQADGAAASRIEADLAEARQHGFTGTPTFLIGEPNGDGGIKVLKKISGAYPFAVFQAALDSMLAGRTR